jgi:carboxyl-terminal processing protease
MKSVAKYLLASICLLFAASTAAAGTTDLWRITFETNWLGPMEAYVEISHEVDRIHGVSKSGAASKLTDFSGDHSVNNGLMVFEATANTDGSFSGSFLAPWREGVLQLTIDGDALSGSVEGGAFAGSVTGKRVQQAGVLRDYRAVLNTLDQVVASKIFAPDDLQTPGYVAFRQSFGEIVELATDDLDLLLGFHLAWKGDPFSHFQLRRSHQSAEEMFAFFDSYRVGFEAATVEFDTNTAVLKVRTMMGADTIEQIEAAYLQIAEQNVDTLVIDLRGNGGGAFAVKPLVEHVIDKPVDAGYFLSQVWNRSNDSLPSSDEAFAAPVWSGWSIISFWKDVQEQDILRVQFRPQQPNFDGDVYILVDETSASATELAVDAFRASGVATLVGRNTAGEMLSQSMFDVGEGFVVSLPVADYYSFEFGRIEGQGVPVDVEADSASALDVTRKLIEDSRVANPADH